MTTTHIWIDEASIYGRMEPTPIQTMVRLQWWEKALTNQRFVGVEALNQEQARRDRIRLKRRKAILNQEQARRDRNRLKRRKAMENCMHGRLPFPIHWSQGVHP